MVMKKNGDQYREHIKFDELPDDALIKHQEFLAMAPMSASMERRMIISGRLLPPAKYGRCYFRTMRELRQHWRSVHEDRPQPPFLTNAA